MIGHRIKGINRLSSRTYLKHDIFCLGKARAFRKAEFTRSLPLRGPAFEKGENDA